MGEEDFVYSLLIGLRDASLNDGREELSNALEAARADAYRAGRIAAAQILREQLTEATRPDQRMTLTIAITAVERGRNLTATEKMKNLMAGMAEFEREEEARANAARIREGGE